MTKHENNIVTVALHHRWCILHWRLCFYPIQRHVVVRLQLHHQSNEWTRGIS